MRRSPRRYDRELPKPAIADVLKELGADVVPTGYGWVRMVCPFCDDTNGSAAVNHEVDAFTCHQCGTSGDALKLLRNGLGVSSYREVLERASNLDPDSGNRQSRKARRTRRASDLL